MDLNVQVVQFDTGGDPGTASTFARQVVLDPTFVLAGAGTVLGGA